MLAAGRRGYCIVDLYGDTHALSRMIDDRQVRKADVEAFMGNTFPLESLPSVEDAERMVGEFRAGMERLDKSETMHELHAAQREQLRESQRERREGVERKTHEISQRHAREKATFEVRQRQTRDAQRLRYLQSVRAVRLERAAHRPRGLAAFLGKVSGVTFLRERLERHQDARRLKTFHEEKRQFKTVQRQERAALAVTHRLQSKEIERQIKAVESVKKREMASLERDAERDRVVLARGPTGAMPSLITLLRGNGERYAPDIDLRADFEERAQLLPSGVLDASAAFNRAADGQEPTERRSGDGATDDLDRAPAPSNPRGKTRDKDPDHER